MDESDRWKILLVRMGYSSFLLTHLKLYDIGILKLVQLYSKLLLPLQFANITRIPTSWYSDSS